MKLQSHLHLELAIESIKKIWKMSFWVTQNWVNLKKKKFGTVTLLVVASCRGVLHSESGGVEQISEGASVSSDSPSKELEGGSSLCQVEAYADRL